MLMSVHSTGAMPASSHNPCFACVASRCTLLTAATPNPSLNRCTSNSPRRAAAVAAAVSLVSVQEVSSSNRDVLTKAACCCCLDMLC